MTKVDIKVDVVQAAVAAMKESSNTVNPETKNVPVVSRCDGIMLSQYYDRIQKIGVLMKKYRTLLLRDASDVLTSVAEIVRVDTELGQGGTGRF